MWAAALFLALATAVSTCVAVPQLKLELVSLVSSPICAELPGFLFYFAKNLLSRSFVMVTARLLLVTPVTRTTTHGLKDLDS